jgi:hypothetical protein
LTRTRPLSLSWARSIQSEHPPPHSTPRSILILYSHLLLGLPSDLPSDFPTKTYASVPSPTSSTGPAHLTLLDLITRIMNGEAYKAWSSSLCNLLHSHVTSFLLGPNVLTSTQFSEKKTGIVTRRSPWISTSRMSTTATT